MATYGDRRQRALLRYQTAAGRMSTNGDTRRESDLLLAEELGLILDELEYLRWIYRNLDFGPAHEDVMGSMNRRYTEDTGCRVPEEYA